MTGGSYTEYKRDFDESSPIGESEVLREELFSARPKTRKAALGARSAHLDDLRERIEEDPEPVRVERDPEMLYDPAFVRNTLTCPDKNAERIFILAIDNSGSNGRVALKMRQDSHHLAGMINAINPRAQIALRYFSDHCDGDRYCQDIDFVFPDKDGSLVISSTETEIQPADGDDGAEAHECVLWDACEVDFAHVSRKNRHLIMVSDVVGHGMGMDSDWVRCPNQRDWRDSVKRVNQTFGSFTFVGTAPFDSMAVKQRQFFPEKDSYKHNLIDLSTLTSTTHRLGIVSNAACFLISRSHGLQAAEMYMMMLYENWLKNPIFARQTDAMAKTEISRFGKFLPCQQGERDAIINRATGQD